MLDFHTHILPGMDDGAQSAEESVALLRMLERDQVAGVVFTPHFYPFAESIPDFLRKRETAFQQLQATLPAFPMPVWLGAEVHLSHRVVFDAEIPKLKISGTDFMLVELSARATLDEILSDLEELIYVNGIHPIIAHIERYPIFRNDPDCIAELIEAGCLIQSNLDAFLRDGRFMGKLARANLIHLLGTDCHRHVGRRPNVQAFRKAAAKLKLEPFVKRTMEMGKLVLNGQMPELPAPKKVKRFFF